MNSFQMEFNSKFKEVLFTYLNIVLFTQHSEDSAGESDEEKHENEGSPQWKLLETIRNHFGPNGNKFFQSLREL